MNTLRKALYIASNKLQFIFECYMRNDVINNPTPLRKVSMWVQLQIPRIEDGNNFGVAVQVILNFENFHI